MSTYYFLPTRNVFGMGASQEAGELMKSLGGHKTMIVTDKFLHESGMAGQIQAILAQAGATMDNVVKTTVFLKDMEDFAEMNRIYQTFFAADCPARSAVQVGRLPKDAKVEIEAIAQQ